MTPFDRDHQLPEARGHSLVFANDIDVLVRTHLGPVDGGTACDAGVGISVRSSVRRGEAMEDHRVTAGGGTRHLGVDRHNVPVARVPLNPDPGYVGRQRRLVCDGCGGRSEPRGGFRRSHRSRNTRPGRDRCWCRHVSDRSGHDTRPPKGKSCDCQGNDRHDKRDRREPRRSRRPGVVRRQRVVGAGAGGRNAPRRRAGIPGGFRLVLCPPARGPARLESGRVGPVRRPPRLLDADHQ